MEEVPGSEETFHCDMVLLAMGYLSPESAVADDLKVDLDSRGNYK